MINICIFLRYRCWGQQGLPEMFGLENRVEGWLQELHTGVYLLTFLAAILMSLPLVLMDINTDRGFRSRARVSQLEQTQSMKYIINLWSLSFSDLSSKVKIFIIFKSQNECWRPQLRPRLRLTALTVRRVLLWWRLKAGGCSIAV